MIDSIQKSQTIYLPSHLCDFFKLGLSILTKTATSHPLFTDWRQFYILFMTWHSYVNVHPPWLSDAFEWTLTNNSPRSPETLICCYLHEPISEWEYQIFILQCTTNKLNTFSVFADDDDVSFDTTKQKVVIVYMKIKTYNEVQPLDRDLHRNKPLWRV